MKTSLKIMCVGFLFIQACTKDDVGDLNAFASPDQDVNNASLSGWTQFAASPTGRSSAFGLSIGNKGYVGGGIGTTTGDDFWEYDPASNKWTRKADFPGGLRLWAISFSIGNKGYVGSGLLARGQGNPVPLDFWEYDPSTDVWTRKADLPEKPFTANATTAFSIGDKGYVGISCGEVQLYEYNPDTNRWTKKATLPGDNRFGSIGFSVGGKGYIGLGIVRGGGRETVMSDIWEFDPAANTWTRKGDFPGPRAEAVAFGIGDKGYVTSGIAEPNSGILKNDLWEYDPAEDNWVLQDLDEYSARSEAVGFSIGNSGFIGFGYTLVGSNFQVNYPRDLWKFTVN